MRPIVPLIYALMVCHAGIGWPQASPISGDLVVNISESNKSSQIEQRLATLLIRELRLQNNKTQPDIVFFNGSPDKLNGWLADKRFDYVARLEVSGGWSTHRRITVPFLLNLYQRNYELRIFAYIYGKEEGTPFYARNYEIKVKGPKVWEVLESNPHDGNLVLSNGEQLEIEHGAEGKVIQKVANDLKSLFKKMEGG